MNQYLKGKQEELMKTVDFFKSEMQSVRTGRANPSILEPVQVSAYGAKSPINALASVNVSDGASIVIAPYDKSTAKDIEKAITEADLGLGIVNEGERIRLTVPKMTEENRKDLVKKINEKQEKARISVRQVREDIKESIEKAFTDKAINEDDKFRFIKELDEEVTKINDQIKELRDKKEEEVMTI